PPAASAGAPESPSERERRRRLENHHRKWKPSARALEQRAAGAARALDWGHRSSAARAAREHASPKNEGRPSARALEQADGVWGHRKRAGRAAPEHWTGPQNQMTKILLVCRRELASMCGGPLAWILAAVFLLLTGYFFYSDLALFVLVGGANQTRGLWRFVFLDFRLVALLVVPLLTMRLFAEERKQGTLELLWTFPVRDGEVLAGKFLAALALYLGMLAATAVGPALLYALHPFAVAPVLAGYAGLALLGVAFVACGAAASTVSENQVGSAMLAYGVLVFA